MKRKELRGGTVVLPATCDLANPELLVDPDHRIGVVFLSFAHDHGRDRVRRTVGTDRRGDIKVDDRVRVDDHEGLVEEGGDVAYAAASTHDGLFPSEVQLHPLGPASKLRLDGARQVMQVDHHLLEAKLSQQPQRIADQRHRRDREQGLRDHVGERLHPRTEPGGQHHRFFRQGGRFVWHIHQDRTPAQVVRDPRFCAHFEGHGKAKIPRRGGGAEIGQKLDRDERGA